MIVNLLNQPFSKAKLTYRFLASFIGVTQSVSALANNQLDPVIVSSTHPDYGLMDSGIHPTEHTVNTLNQSMLEVFKPNKTEELVVYLPNIQTARLGAGIGEDFIVRGFSLGGRLLLDGTLDNQSYYIRDTATIQRVNIIKGHDSVLYGTGAPGGTVNFITKKPQYEPKNSLTVELGSFNHKRVVLDSTGPVNSKRDLAYRSILAIQESDSWKKNVTDDRTTFLNSLQWNYQPKSHLSASWEFSAQSTPYDFDNVYAKGAPVYDVSYVHPNTRADRVFNRLTLDWRHALKHNNALAFTANVIKGNRDEKQIGFYYLYDETKPLVGYYREEDETFEQSNIKLTYHQTFRLQNIENEFTAGVEQNTTEAHYQNGVAINAFGLDIYQPTFDFPLPAPADLSVQEGHTQWRDQSIFIQNIAQLTSDLEFRAGFRQSDFNLDNQRDGVFKRETEQSHLAKSFGFRWFTLKNITLYASYSQSYLPNTGRDRQNNYFDPQLGEQKELGWTYQSNDQKIKLNMALFDITQSNILIKDPIDSDYKILAGQKQVTGAELQAQLALSTKLNLTVNIGQLDPRIRQTDNGTQGNLFPSVPQETRSVVLEYQALSNLSLYAGAVYQGKRAGDLQNSFFVDGYTRYDLAARWNINPSITLNASVQNATDMNYVTYATAQDFVRLGHSRIFNLSLTGLF